MGKGSKYRPYSTSREERDLRDALARGKISFKEFERKYNKLMDEGKITRDGRVVRRSG